MRKKKHVGISHWIKQKKVGLEWAFKKLKRKGISIDKIGIVVIPKIINYESEGHWLSSICMMSLSEIKWTGNRIFLKMSGRINIY